MSSNPHPLLMVQWEDAVGGDDVTEPAHALTVGWLIKDAGDYIVVASEIFEDGDSRDKTVIPRGMIEDISVIRKKNPFKNWRAI